MHMTILNLLTVHLYCDHLLYSTSYNNEIYKSAVGVYGWWSSAVVKLAVNILKFNIEVHSLHDMTNKSLMSMIWFPAQAIPMIPNLTLCTLYIGNAMDIRY